MRIEWPESFPQRIKWEQDAAKAGDALAKKRLVMYAALLDALKDLQEKPAHESATFCRVRQAKKHELWRVAHPFDPDVAVRIIVWFPRTGGVVVTVFSFDKAKLGDIWYDRAAKEGQAMVDQWLREHTDDEDEEHEQEEEQKDA